MNRIARTAVRFLCFVMLAALLAPGAHAAPPVAGAVLHVDASTLSVGTGINAASTPVNNLGTGGGSFNAGTYDVEANVFGTLSALKFDGASQYLYSLNAYNNSGTLLTMFMVSKRITSKGQYRAHIGCAAVGQGDHEITGFCYQEGGSFTMYGERGGNLPSQANPGNGVPFIGTMKFDNVNCTHYQKLHSASTSASTAKSGNFAITRITLGSRIALNDWANIYIGEVLIYNSALDDTDRLAVESYLATKWGMGGQTHTWDGGGGSDSFSDAGNWDVNGAPHNNADDIWAFGGTTRLTPSHNLGNDFDVGGITFNNTAGAFFVGGNSIDLFGNIVNNDDSLQTLRIAGIELLGAPRTVNAAAGNIAIGTHNISNQGLISGSQGLIKEGSYTLTLHNHDNTFSGNITINAGTLATDSSQGEGANPTATVLGNPQVTRTITVANGTLSINGTDRLGSGGTTFPAGFVIELNSGGLLTSVGATDFNAIGTLNLNGGTLRATGANGAQYRSWSLNGGATVTVGGATTSTMEGTGSLNIGLNLKATTTFDVLANSTLNVTTLPLANTVSYGAANLIKTGPGLMTVGVACLYTGTTAVNGGTLRINSPGSLNASSAVTVGGAGANTPTLAGNGTVGGTVTVSGTAPAGTIAGVNGSTLTLQNGLNLQSGSKSTFDLTGTPGSALINVTAGTLTQGGNTMTITATAVGTYPVIQYTSAEVSGFTIDVPGSTPDFTYSITYTGTGPRFVNVVVSGAAEPTTSAGNPTFANVGAQQMDVSCTAGNGANRLVVMSTSTITATPSDGVVYTPNAAFGIGQTIAGGVYVVGTGNGPITVTGLLPFTTYYVKVFEFNGSGGGINYKQADPGNASQATTTKELTIGGGTFTATTKVYDGTTAATMSGNTLTLTGVVTPHVVFVDTAAVAFADKNQGVGKTVNLTGASYTLGGANAASYTLSFGGAPSGTGDITTKPLTVTGLSVPGSRVYNGTTDAVESGTPALLPAVAAPGVLGDGAPISGDTVNITGVPATGTYNDKDVADANLVTFNGLGSDNVNYTITAPTQAATITAAALTVTASAQVKEFGATLAPGPTPGHTGFTPSGLGSGDAIDSVSVSYGSGREAADPDGVYVNSITISDATGGSFTPGNYNITYNPANLTVGLLRLVAEAEVEEGKRGPIGTAAVRTTALTVTYGVTPNYLDGNLFEIISGELAFKASELEPINAEGDEYYVEITASASGVTTDKMLVKVTVVSGAVSGTIFMFR